MAPFIIESKPSKEFEKPTEGMHQLVIAAINDLGIVKSVYEGKEKETPTLEIVFQTAARDKEGKRFLIFQQFTKSLHEKAKLRAAIKDMSGKEPPMTMDISVLIGFNAEGLIFHKPTKKDPTRTYAKIKAFMKLPSGKEKLAPEPFVDFRKKDAAGSPAQQTGNAAAPKSNAITPEHPITDEDVPF